MKFERALEVMRSGEKIRLGDCRCGLIIDKCQEFSTIIDNNGDEAKISSAEILSDEWQLID